jgi:2-polyprenyl-3-methyl-5-hydroxy-6-metoxy-1,4-benzoquinol methylase
LEELLETKPRMAALEEYVGGGQRYSIGHREKEAIARHHPLQGAAIVDVGCGIGRLTTSLAGEPIASYLGTDILPEVLDEARLPVAGDPRYRFALVDGLTIPAEPASTDIVCAFSVITHLMDEEVFEIFREAARVLRPGGVAVFSFLDFSHPRHRDHFLQLVKERSIRHDVLKCFEKSTLDFFADATGFDVDEYLDAYASVPAKFPDQTLPDGTRSGQFLIMGQSLGFFRRR